MFRAYIARTPAGELKVFSIAPGENKPVRRRGDLLQYLAGPSRGATKKEAKENVLLLKSQALMLARRWAVSSPIGYREKPSPIVYVPSLGDPTVPPPTFEIDVMAEISE